MTPNINFPIEVPRVTLRFGATHPPQYYGPTNPHRGVDLSPYPGAFGAPIDACMSGMVTKTENHKYAGKSIFVEGVSSFTFSSQDRWGNWYEVPKGTKLTNRMTHFQRVSVETGQEVRKGQFLGEMGATGFNVTGAHLHLELWAHLFGKTVILDPMLWFASGLAGFWDQVIWRG